MKEKKKICFVVHTEYHILISVHEILTRYNDSEAYDIQMIIKRSNRSSKLEETLNLSSLPIRYQFWDYGISLDKALTNEQRERIDAFLSSRVDEFIFFQEQDPLTVILVNQLAQHGTRIYLYQDGLKPYVKIKFFSISLMKHNIQQNRWIKRNGYKAQSFFCFLVCKNYGFSDSISKLFLTFPDRYDNWNDKPVERIALHMTPEFRDVLKKVYGWSDSLLDRRETVIFYMNQPMHDDGVFETELLNNIAGRFPDRQLYIKLHPLTNKIKLDRYRSLNNVKIIQSPIPAEVFIGELANSVILSVCSTSMFIDNPNCRFYWLNKIAEDHIPRLKRYHIVNPTDHIITADTLNDIV